MTEEQPEPRITNTQKEKDPRKVAAGKKLGAISKMVKNQKKCREAEAESTAEREAESVAQQNLGNTFFYAGLAAVVVVGCLGTLYWNSIAGSADACGKASRKQQPKQDLPKPQEAPEAPKFRTSLASLTHRGTHSNLISLDD